MLVFQSTPPRGRRPASASCAAAVVPFQSTPPRGRRLVLRRLCLVLLRVSIHASAREATEARGSHGVINFVSIHASAREATNYS